MFRIKIALVVLGGMLGYFGFQEFRVSMGTSSTAASVELVDLESGNAPPNNYVRLGEHTALYPAAIYSYEQSKYDSSEPGNSTKVSYCYYPVLSNEHPFLVSLYSDDEEEPELSNVAVIIKSKQFKTIGAIPDDLGDVKSIEGLIINQIGSLDSEEKKLIRESFPRIDVEKVILLEAGRKPSSMLTSVAMLGGGGVMILLGLVWMFVGAGSKE